MKEEKKTVSESGSLTVEAALVMSTVLLILGTVFGSALSSMKKVQGKAAAQAAEPPRYESGLKPSDIVRISLFIKEWIPPKGQ